MSHDNRLAGFYRFVIGPAKKVLIANQMGAQADLIFSQDYHTLSTGRHGLEFWHIHSRFIFDFSGYSDMALNSQNDGFKLPENFNSPYVSRSITEFWRRWHITFGKHGCAITFIYL